MEFNPVTKTEYFIVDSSGFLKGSILSAEKRKERVETVPPDGLIKPKRNGERRTEGADIRESDYISHPDFKAPDITDLLMFIIEFEKGDYSKVFDLCLFRRIEKKITERYIDFMVKKGKITEEEAEIIKLTPQKP